ncbi:hypothetical protein [Nocardia macrotermitis]|nr:hypothetical protein [Nocardia macrotermitis]
MTSTRNARYQRLSTFLASRDDDALADLVAVGRVVNVGVGGSASLVEIDGVPVFTKRIPLTNREVADPDSTANLFEVPLFGQYGIGGGPGFSVRRELEANLILTDAVLAGQTQAFPILYHWRVLPGRSPIPDEHADIDAAVSGRGGSPAVRARLEALIAADRSLVLFCEYIPHPITDWLAEDPVGRAAAFEQQLSEITAFLRDRQLLHMDAHLGNMRADKDRWWFHGRLCVMRVWCRGTADSGCWRGPSWSGSSISTSRTGS